jgi:hypothetical protein
VVTALPGEVEVDDCVYDGVEAAGGESVGAAVAEVEVDEVYDGVEWPPRWRACDGVPLPRLR